MNPDDEWLQQLSTDKWWSLKRQDICIAPHSKELSLTAEALRCGSHSFHTANTPHLTLPVGFHQTAPPVVIAAIWLQLTLTKLVMATTQSGSRMFSMPVCWRSARLSGRFAVDSSMSVALVTACEAARTYITRVWLSLIHIWRCRRSTLCRSRWSPYH